MSSSFFVAWRTGEQANGQWGPVGRLDHVGPCYRFVYTRGARGLEGFGALPGMDDRRNDGRGTQLGP